MSIPTTNQCCCGCSLRTGVLILAYLGLIGVVISAIQYASLRDKPDSRKTPYQKQMEAVKPIGIIINGVLSAVLLYGVHQESPTAILSAVYFQLVVMFVYFTAITFIALVAGAISIIPIFLVSMLIGLYFIWVEYSYAEELKNKTTNPTSIA